MRRRKPGPQQQLPGKKRHTIIILDDDYIEIAKQFKLLHRDSDAVMVHRLVETVVKLQARIEDLKCELDGTNYLNSILDNCVGGWPHAPPLALMTERGFTFEGVMHTCVEEEMRRRRYGNGDHRVRRQERCEESTPPRESTLEEYTNGHN